MPRFRVTETRCFRTTYLIDAADEDAAKGHQGDVIDSSDDDSWTESIDNIEQVDDNEDCA